MRNWYFTVPSPPPAFRGARHDESPGAPPDPDWLADRAQRLNAYPIHAQSSHTIAMINACAASPTSSCSAAARAILSSGTPRPGKSVSITRLGTNQTVKREEETQVHSIVCWDRLAEADGDTELCSAMIAKIEGEYPTTAPVPDHQKIVQLVIAPFIEPEPEPRKWPPCQPYQDMHSVRRTLALTLTANDCAGSGCPDGTHEHHTELLTSLCTQESG
jgi:hypothetical protein